MSYVSPGSKYGGEKEKEKRKNLLPVKRGGLSSFSGGGGREFMRPKPKML